MTLLRKFRQRRADRREAQRKRAVMLGMMRELSEMAQISPVGGPDKTA